ncbi:YybH family protein [Sphingomonas sp.]|uniref:YybH family protein n=1 Tax=Sphingomonas sp. TaxID=28214 RepID=UPI003B3AB0E0
MSGKVPAQQNVEDVLAAYEKALNGSDIDAVLAAFGPEAVFMAPNNPSAVGLEQLRAAYTGIFQTIAFETELQVQEFVQVAPDWAFVRTDSAGFVTIRATDQRVPDSNHELFIFHKDDADTWKIARYAFSTTNPLPQ